MLVVWIEALTSCLILASLVHRMLHAANDRAPLPFLLLLQIEAEVLEGWHRVVAVLGPLIMIMIVLLFKIS